MNYFPLYYQLENKPCLLIGGGSVALRKATMLLRYQVKLTVVALEVSDEVRQLVSEHQGTIEQRAYQASDLAGQTLVVAATSDEAVNQQISVDAQALNLPVNVVDSPELCSFIFPAIVDRGPINIAISSAGQSPVLARMLRTRIESMIPANFGKLAELAGSFRDQVKARFPQINQRRLFWEKTLNGPVAEQVYAGRHTEAEASLLAALQQEDETSFTQGEVYLVGAGPGDPDLLTFKALRLMQQADVVVYDRLVSKGIMELCRRDADFIHVGKAASNHTMPQQDINELLVTLAQEGKRVCRLKGGDPFIFGRGGEEIDRLMQSGIPFQVVPGITAAAGCAAYSGIPLTHRDYAQSVRFLTGHLKDERCDLPWEQLVLSNETLVFYMGLISLPHICSELIKHGMPADMPVALIERGTLPVQRVRIGTLATMPELIQQHNIKPPTLTIVGNVVKLHEQLAWYGEQGEGDGPDIAFNDV